MFNFLYRVFIFCGILAAIAAAATGLSALVPGLVALPVAVGVIAIPALIFLYFTRQVILADTARKISSRGWPKIADTIERRGRNLDFMSAQGSNLARLNLEGFSMRGADLEEARLSEARAPQSDFSNAFMKKTRLMRGNFKHSHFYHAMLRRSKLQYSDFTGANFSGADLRGSNLKGAKLSHANLKGANLKGAVFNSETILPFSRKKAFKRGMIAV